MIFYENISLILTYQLHIKIKEIKLKKNRIQGAFNNL